MKDCREKYPFLDNLTTRENAWFSLRLKAFVADQTLKGL
jgi:hypothetical protein